MVLFPFRYLWWLIGSLRARLGRPPDYVTFLIEEEMPAKYTTPEVEVRGDEAVIRVKTPESIEERKVKLPKTTWA